MTSFRLSEEEKKQLYGWAAKVLFTVAAAPWVLIICLLLLRATISVVFFPLRVVFGGPDVAAADAGPTDAGVSRQVTFYSPPPPQCYIHRPFENGKDVTLVYQTNFNYPPSYTQVVLHCQNGFWVLKDSK